MFYGLLINSMMLSTTFRPTITLKSRKLRFISKLQDLLQKVKFLNSLQLGDVSFTQLLLVTGMVAIGRGC